MGSFTVRLDDNDHELLRLISFLTKESQQQIINRLIHAEIDAKLPGRRNQPPGQRTDLLEALGLPPLAPDADADAWAAGLFKHLDERDDHSKGAA